jgi:hypothetical protein
MRYQKILFLPTLFVFFLLGGCATPYQSVDLLGGFSETQLAPDSWTITFRGNGYSSRERVTNFTLLRSAEITLENGYSYFIIVNKDRFKRSSLYLDSNIFLYDEKPRESNTIVCFHDRPKINGMVYDAKFLVTSLKNKYGMEI